MATFELGRLHVARSAVREWRGTRHLPLYIAGLIGGVGIAAGMHSAADQVSFTRSATPAEIQAPFVGARDIKDFGEPARPPAPVVGGTLDAEILTGDIGLAPVTITVDAAPQAPAASTPEPAAVVPSSAPAASIPLSPAQPETAPALVVPAAPSAPAPEAAAPEPVAPAQSNFYLPAVTSGPMTSLEQRLFDGLNAERVAAGLAPYIYDPGLSTIARTRSQQMVDQGYFGHKDPYGYSMYVELLAHFGYLSYAWAGENLAVNNYAEFESPERAMVSLMNSPTHRSNILQTLFTRVGIGEVTHADGRKFYAMIFLS